MNKKNFNYILAFVIAIIAIFGLSKLLKTQDNSKEYYIKINNTSFTEQEWQVHYVLCFHEFVNNYTLELEEMGFDQNKDFALQQFNENYTFEDFFIAQTEESLKRFVVLIEDAEENGVEIDAQEDIDAVLSIFEDNSEYLNVSYEEYIKSLFGPNVERSDVESAVNLKYKAQKYDKMLENDYLEKVDDKELVSLYTQFPNSFDTITFRRFFVDFSILAHDEAHSFVETFLEHCASEDDFVNLVEEISPDTNTLFSDTGVSGNYSDAETAWLYSDERKYGDLTYLEIDNGLVILFFKERALLSEPSVDFRHIFIDTVQQTAEEKAQSKQEIDAIFSMLQSNPSEEEFSSYALIFSDDVISSQKGGLYSNVRQSDLDNALGDWLFDEERKPGDISRTESDVGYHIVFFVKKGDFYWKNIARKFLSQSKYESHLNERLEKITLEKAKNYKNIILEDAINNFNSENSENSEDISENSKDLESLENIENHSEEDNHNH